MKVDEDVQSTKDEDGNPAHAAAGRLAALSRWSLSGGEFQDWAGMCAQRIVTGPGALPLSP